MNMLNKFGQMWMCRRLWAAVLAVAGMFGAVTNAAAEAAAFVLILHDHGKQIRISSDSPGAKDLVSQCEELLRTADGVLRLAVTPQLIASLQQRERALEISYSEPQTFEIPFSHYQFQASRLLIPLSGDFAEGSATIFYGDTEYSHGPYRNNKGVEAIAALANTLHQSQ